MNTPAVNFQITGNVVSPEDLVAASTASADVRAALDFIGNVPQDGNLHEVATFSQPAFARGKANGLNSSSHLIDKAQFVARGTSLYCRVLTPEEGAARVAERDRRRAIRKAEKAAAKAEAAARV